ncbi:kinase-like domain-containing protein [Elsinoe ampelina]|uniref:Kinase-like domain-containing protein n=1 Tax=Elsinoe ampelina TaxID=302913 RepID=A0A6A6GEZ5_9PEZI|nr:kinase-like domain-containing protein [Elsinoe ampelina]
MVVSDLLSPRRSAPAPPVSVETIRTLADDKNVTIKLMRRIGDKYQYVVKRLSVARDERTINMKRELDFARNLQHPSIARFTCVVDSIDFAEIHADYAGQVLQTAIDNRCPISESGCSSIIRQISDALDYLRREKVVHRDIKPANLAVSSWQPMRVHLIDFGIARNISRRRDGYVANLWTYTLLTSDRRTWTVCGTRPYMAPEIIALGLGMTNLVSTDYHNLYVWSLGATIWTCKSLEYARTFDEEHEREISVTEASTVIEIPEATESFIRPPRLPSFASDIPNTASPHLSSTAGSSTETEADVKEEEEAEDKGKGSKIAPPDKSPTAFLDVVATNLRVRNLDLPEGRKMSPSFVDLLESMTALNPKDRPLPSAIEKHVYFQENDTKEG